MNIKEELIGNTKSELTSEQILVASSRPDVIAPAEEAAFTAAKNHITTLQSTINKAIDKYSGEIKMVLGSKMKPLAKAAEVQRILGTTLKELNEKQVFDSTCTDTHKVPMLLHPDTKDASNAKKYQYHLISVCPGDPIRSELINYFLKKVYEVWRGKSAQGTMLAVEVDRTDGQCDNHHQYMLLQEPDDELVHDHAENISQN